MGNGLQTFLRMANLYNPDEMQGGMPSQLPVQPRGTPPIQAAPRRPTFDEEVFAGVGPQDPNEELIPDEEVFAQAEQPQSTLDMFRQSVMNPPQRKQMTYPKNTLAGLDAALKIAAEPSPLAKNRVWVNGQAHQKQKVMTDPVTGEKKFITDVHEPAFMDQVMRAMPAAVSPAVDILNQPHEDAVTDWELKNKGLGAAAKAESDMALAAQRNANAGYTGQRADIERDKVEVSRMTAEERVRLSRLNTLTDVQKIEMVQSGKMSLAEYNASEALRRVMAQQAGATERTGMQQTGATERTGMQQTGATERTGMQQEGATRRNTATIGGAMDRTIESGNQARQTKIAPGNTSTSAGSYPSQKKIVLQDRVHKFINENPNFAEYVTFSAQGFPVISQDAPEDIQAIMYENFYGGQPDVNLPVDSGAAPIAAPTGAAPGLPGQAERDQRFPPNPVTAPAAAPEIIKQYSPSRDQTRISTDGGKTWKVVQGKQ